MAIKKHSYEIKAKKIALICDCGGKVVSTKFGYNGTTDKHFREYMCRKCRATKTFWGKDYPEYPKIEFIKEVLTAYENPTKSKEIG